jgi:hypothetical protein
MYDRMKVDERIIGGKYSTMLDPLIKDYNSAIHYKEMYWPNQINNSRNLNQKSKDDLDGRIKETKGKLQQEIEIGVKKERMTRERKEKEEREEKIAEKKKNGKKVKKEEQGKKK